MPDLLLEGFGAGCRLLCSGGSQSNDSIMQVASPGPFYGPTLRTAPDKLRHGGNTAGVVDATAVASDGINTVAEGTNPTSIAAAFPVAIPVAMESSYGINFTSFSVGAILPLL